MDEISVLTTRLNRLGETGASEGLTQSVVATIQEKVAQQRRLEEELKILRSGAFSMATPREDARRSRAASEQPAVSEDEAEQQKRAKEALQIVRRLEPEAVQQVEPVGLKKLIHLFLQSLRKLTTQAIETLIDLAPQYLEWVRNNPNTAAATVMLSAVHAIGIQQGSEISGYQLLLGYLRTLGAAPLAADAISSIMQGVASVVGTHCFRSIDDEARRP